MAAMDTLHDDGAQLPEMPGFDDGMVDVRELVCTIAESVVNEVMDAQADDACADGNVRHG